MITKSKLYRIADVITREAIGFPTEEAYKKYMKTHPKADPKNHWVEKNPEDKTPIDTKKPELYKVPQTIGGGTIDMTKTVLRSQTPNEHGEYKWFDFGGKEVTDPKTLFRANRLARELSVLGSNLQNVRVFTDYRPHSKKPFAMVYLDTWEKRKAAAPFKYFYTEIQAKESNDKIMAKNMKFSKAFSANTGKLLEDAEAGIPEAVVVHLINKHHIRIGTKGQKNQGICTMRAKYCTATENSIVIKNMPAKSNKKYSGVITDPILVREFKKRLKNKQPNDLVFGDTDDKKVNDYLKKTLGDKSFSNKNLRTCEATGIAFKVVTEMAVDYKEDGTWKPKTLTLDKKYAIMAEACKQAAESLNNTPEVCHSNYIDNRVFNILALPDDVYHKENPIVGKDKDGNFIFKWEAAIDKTEASMRRKMDDDKYNLWDLYSEAKDELLQKLNEDRRRDGWDKDLTRLPKVHATALIKSFLSRLPQKEKV